MEWQIIYYDEKVQEAVEQWPVGIRAVYTRVTERMMLHGPNLGMPFTRSIGNGLFEIRLKGKGGIGRAFYCTIVNKQILILHVFRKKTQKTPRRELEIAMKRLKERRNEIS
ncbi:MAG: hypothetical protein MAG581_00405 [Deltaproteobacteria bacterium]|jgi:phage-related protein|nr:hypothetical protein [Deltaproteobacteria bacterium]